MQRDLEQAIRISSQDALSQNCKEENDPTESIVDDKSNTKTVKTVETKQNNYFTGNSLKICSLFII